MRAVKTSSNLNAREIVRKIFDIHHEPMPRGAWWWWFWLFFFNNPDNPAKPRQLMILWSTKNVSEIDCNGLKIELKQPLDRRNLDGAVAAWYFDGDTMHHNFLLEQCVLNIADNMLHTDSSVPTSYSIGDKESTIKIGSELEFITENGNTHKFAAPTYYSNTYIRDMSFSMLRLNHQNLRGRIKSEPILGSAYFQRVFVNAPVVPWYWGIFHFENGCILTYFNQYLLGKAFNAGISFFDGDKVHEFADMNITRASTDIPTFAVYGETEHEKMSFTVKSYAQSSWTFRKK
ncbi:MAG: hypothetical protein U9R10_03515, partial [Euryarchaeota archaeon]|nr:hypothetical protein [Euryarchaeota archaeon]